MKLNFRKSFLFCRPAGHHGCCPRSWLKSHHRLNSSSYRSTWLCSEKIDWIKKNNRNVDPPSSRPESANLVCCSGWWPRCRFWWPCFRLQKLPRLFPRALRQWSPTWQSCWPPWRRPRSRGWPPFRPRTIRGNFGFLAKRIKFKLWSRTKGVTFSGVHYTILYLRINIKWSKSEMILIIVHLKLKNCTKKPFHMKWMSIN